MDGCLKEMSGWTERMKDAWEPSVGRNSRNQESQSNIFPTFYWGWEKAGLFIIAVQEIFPHLYA